jgi:hypothetical protein
MAATHGSGLSVMPAGNLLLGSRFLDTDPSGMSVRFSVPGPGFTLDPGDGTAPIPTDATGFIDHVYAPLTGQPHPWVFSVALTDNLDGRWRGWLRFELPKGPYAPLTVAAVSF